MFGIPDTQICIAYLLCLALALACMIVGYNY